MKTIVKIFIPIFLFSFLVTPGILFAAHITLDTPVTTVTQGETFLVTLKINTDGKAMNAITGDLVFPEGILELEEVRDGNSSINFWVERPDTSSKSTVHFSGITPGGYNGSEGALFSLVFRATHTGVGSIGMKNLEVLQNDGVSTKLPTQANQLKVSVSAPNGESVSSVEPVDDTQPPESFSIAIVQNQEMFDGKAFIVFTTQDKGSGIDHYEVKEGVFDRYSIAKSPYILQDQHVNKKIFVKAVDKNNNTRISVVYPKDWRPWNTSMIIILCVGLFATILFVLKRKGIL